MSDVSKRVLEKRVKSPKGAAIVDDLLYHFPEARGDDRRLYWRYVTQVLGVKLPFSEASKLFAGFSADTLGRRRRELIVAARETGDSASLDYLLPRAGTQRKRCKREEVYREYFSRKQLMDFGVFA